MAKDIGSERSFVAGRAATVLLSATVAMTASSGLSASEWRPAKEVEIIVPTAPGGGVDSLARIVQKIIVDKRLTDVSSVVVNKAGGGGAIGYAYLNRPSCLGHCLAIAPIGIVTNDINGASSIRYTDVTPVSLMGSEYIAFGVRNESSVTTVKDLANQLRRDPQSMSIAASSRGGPNHIAIALAMKSMGVDVSRMKVVIFKSGGEGRTAVLGGHVDVITASPSVLAPQIKAGKLRAIGVTSPQRLDGLFADVPTLKEQGIETVFSNWRVALGSKDMSREQVEYWEKVLLAVTRTDEWKQFLQASMVENTYLNGDATKMYMDAQYKELRAVLKDLGLAK